MRTDHILHPRRRALSLVKNGGTGIRSEVGQLRRVVLHRPGRELDRITPDDQGSQLFDDVPWLAAAQTEHDQFRMILENHGAEVIELGELIERVLSDTDADQAWLDMCVSDAVAGTYVHERLRAYLARLSAPAIREILFSGLTLTEFDDSYRELDGLIDADRYYVIDPIPNAVFVRDSGVWIDDTMVSTRFATAVRRREAEYVTLAWQRSGARTLSTGPGRGPAVEGGDVMVAGNGCVLIGVSSRTAAAGAVELARELLTLGHARSVLLIRLPSSRSTMHLDTVMTMVDWDTFLISDDRLASAAVFRARLGGDGRIVLAVVDDLFGHLAGLLGVPSIRRITAGGDVFARRREQWSDGANVLAVRPGVVVTYDRNRHSNDALARAGVEVLTLPSGELARGRGGPHCMSCPVLRD